jgi:hypothetical protein
MMTEKQFTRMCLRDAKKAIKKAEASGDAVAVESARQALRTAQREYDELLLPEIQAQYARYHGDAHNPPSYSDRQFQTDGPDPE